MEQLLPKDLLIHLETGNRTSEHLKNIMADSAYSDAAPNQIAQAALQQAFSQAQGLSNLATSFDMWPGAFSKIQQR